MLEMPKRKLISPAIRKISWGRMEIDGFGSGKDFKLWPGGAREWDWKETDTQHIPGIQPADVKELLNNGCKTIVLSQGMLQRLKTSGDTLALLKTEGVRVHIAQTKKAVKIYNDLVEQGEAVGGLFHSTC